MLDVRNFIIHSINTQYCKSAKLKQICHKFKHTNSTIFFFYIHYFIYFQKLQLIWIIIYNLVINKKHEIFCFISYKLSTNSYKMQKNLC